MKSRSGFHLTNTYATVADGRSCKLSLFCHAWMHPWSFKKPVLYHRRRNSRDERYRGIISKYLSKFCCFNSETLLIVAQVLLSEQFVVWYFWLEMTGNGCLHSHWESHSHGHLYFWPWHIGARCENYTHTHLLYLAARRLDQHETQYKQK